MALGAAGLERATRKATGAGHFFMGKSWENDEHQGIFHGKMRAQGFFSWENHGKNMETKPSMNDICAIAMI